MWAVGCGGLKDRNWRAGLASVWFGWEHVTEVLAYQPAEQRDQFSEPLLNISLDTNSSVNTHLLIYHNTADISDVILTSLIKFNK